VTACVDERDVVVTYSVAGVRPGATGIRTKRVDIFDATLMRSIKTVRALPGRLNNLRFSIVHHLSMAVLWGVGGRVTVHVGGIRPGQGKPYIWRPGGMANDPGRIAQEQMGFSSLANDDSRGRMGPGGAAQGSHGRLSHFHPPPRLFCMDNH
jgi:hypothetical protein